MCRWRVCITRNSLYDSTWIESSCALLSYTHIQRRNIYQCHRLRQRVEATYFWTRDSSRRICSDCLCSAHTKQKKGGPTFPTLELQFVTMDKRNVSQNYFSPTQEPHYPKPPVQVLDSYNPNSRRKQSTTWIWKDSRKGQWGAMGSRGSTAPCRRCKP